jgi:excisionase family DNA binding protein
MQITHQYAAPSSTVAVSNGQTPPLVKLGYTKSDAAKTLSVSVRTIDNLIANKELPVRRIGKRVVIPYAALVSFMKSDHSTERVQ